MKILGIDPGTVNMGFGVIEVGKHTTNMVDCGVLEAPPQASSIEERLSHFYGSLLKIIARHQPDAVAIEQPFVAKNVKSALAIGRAQAVAMLAAAGNGIPVYEYAPAEIKQKVADYGASSKEQVQEMVKLQLGLPEVPQPSDAADAIAVALCHLREAELKNLLDQNE